VIPPKLQDDQARLEALRRYWILDSPQEQAFDDVTFLASRVCDTPIALISFVDEKRQWFKSALGLDLRETAVEVSFCAHAVAAGQMLIVPDACQDPRFCDNPFVIGRPHVRFYAGVPLVSPEGLALGTLCVLDDRPRQLSERSLEALVALSRQVTSLLEQRRSLSELEQTVSRLQRAEEWTAAQSRILKQMASGAPLRRVLEEIVLLIEKNAPETLASILTLNEDTNTLRHAAAPSLPESYQRLVDGLRIGPRAGSCGTAAYLREPVVVSDVETDPLWADYWEFALPYGLRACWSVPVLSADGAVLGTFAMYYSERRGPTEDDLRLLGQATHLAEIALSQARAEETLRRSEQQLRQAQKMEAVGQLAGGVAHDFNNLLGVIVGYSGLLMDALGPVDRRRPLVTAIEAAADQAAALTRQLLAFGRRQVLQPRRLDLNAVLDETAKLLRRLIGEDIELVLNRGAELAAVEADPVQLQQVLLNLAVNARDAMPTGGRLTIETANCELDATFSRIHSEIRPGPHVMLRVTDTGMGISPAALQHVFEPFFTTKDAGKGTGLGLSTVYGIVRQSGGCITVVSSPGSGAQFTVYLPPAPSDRPDAAGPHLKRVAQGSETILVVEDEELLRRLTCRLLQTSGYRVLQAANGAEALEVARAYEAPIHLLVTDVVMPGMSGATLAAQLLAARPEIKVLYVSGYASDLIARHGVADGSPSLLHKPFSRDALSSRVRELLDGRRPG
jgi:hypothetical protein